MILRKLIIRQGRRAFAAPQRRAWIRSLTTQSPHQPPIDPPTPATVTLEADLDHQSSSEPSVSSTDSPKTNSSNTKTINSPVAKDHRTFKHITSTTGTLGSTLAPYYRSSKLINQPLRPQDITLEVLLASQAHMGHATSLWNPANQRYITGIRDGIHIISLEVTAAHLRRACRVVEGVAYHGGLILFVGTREGQYQCVVKAAELAKGCHLFERWVPGAITNGNQILGLGGMRAIDENDEDIKIASFQEKLTEHPALKPDLVVVLNPLENYVCLHECALNTIPTIGIIDTDADPAWVTYPIPANDDSLRCVQLIAGVLGRAAETGHRRRLEAARNGVVTWDTADYFYGWTVQDEEYMEKYRAKRYAGKLVENEAKEMEMRVEEERRLALE